MTWSSEHHDKRATINTINTATRARPAPWLRMDGMRIHSLITSITPIRRLAPGTHAKKTEICQDAEQVRSGAQRYDTIQMSSAPGLWWISVTKNNSVTVRQPTAIYRQCQRVPHASTSIDEKGQKHSMRRAYTI